MGVIDPEDQSDASVSVLGFPFAFSRCGLGKVRG